MQEIKFLESDQYLRDKEGYVLPGAENNAQTGASMNAETVVAGLIHDVQNITSSAAPYLAGSQYDSQGYYR